MAAKKGFHGRVWDEIINGGMDGKWIDGVIEQAKQRPDDPFADVGPLLAEMLKKGVTKNKIARLARFIRYEAVAETITIAAEDGMDAEALDAAHEDLLTADPSGKDGRPGSWPIEDEKHVKAKGKGAAKAAKPKDPNAPLLKLPNSDDYAFSSDGKRLWLARTTTSSSTVRVFEIPSGEQVGEFNSLPNLRRIAVSPDNKFIATSNHYGIVALHEGVKGSVIWNTKKTNVETSDLVYAPDGLMILSSGSEQLVRRRKATTGEELEPIDFGTEHLTGNLVFAPDRRTLAIHVVKVPGEDIVVYCDWKSGKELRRSALDDVSHIAFTPDGKQLVTGDFDGFRTFDAKTFKPGKRVSVEKLKSISVHPDGKLVAVNTYNGSLILEFPAGKAIKKLDMKALYPSDFAFSPSGRHLLLVGSKSLLWDLESLIGAR
ncbi:MAG TPA: WD40 repeat domain-containing protein [Tepidisphaeraceae bacterium]|jgi:hypothetical protein